MAELSTTTTDNAIDQWFFTFMAGLLAIVAVVGFLPNSMAILNGTMENPDFLVHVHAALMFGWVGLFVAQASMIATDKRSTHIFLGGAGTFVALAMILSMICLAITRFPAEAPVPLHTVVLFQARRVVLFAAFVAFALWLRKKDSDTHKRLLLLATMVPLDAAWNRMDFLYFFGMEGRAIPMRIHEFVVFAPLIAFDLHKLGTVHKATAIGGLLFFGTAALVIISAGWR
jgi:hypothetical protein